MYDYLKGILISKQPSAHKGANIVIECADIGYSILTTRKTIENLGETGKNIKIFVSLIHREDAMILCGFFHKEDRDIFNILQSVSGVGLKVALVLLDEFSGCELISAVIKEDFKLLSRAKGVGAKLAQKIVLELKDKLINWQKTSPIDLDIEFQNAQNGVNFAQNNKISQNSISDAQSVLLSLGYSPIETKDALSFALKNALKDESEEILRLALSYLAPHSGL